MKMTGQEEFTALEQYIRSRSSKVKRSGSGIVFNCFYHNDNLPCASMKIGRNGMPMCYCSVCGSILRRKVLFAIQREKKTLNVYGIMGVSVSLAEVQILSKRIYCHI